MEQSKCKSSYYKEKVSVEEEEEEVEVRPRDVGVEVEGVYGRLGVHGLLVNLTLMEELTDCI